MLKGKEFDKLHSIKYTIDKQKVNDKFTVKILHINTEYVFNIY